MVRTRAAPASTPVAGNSVEQAASEMRDLAVARLGKNGHKEKQVGKKREASPIKENGGVKTARVMPLSYRDFQPRSTGDRVLSCGTGDQIGHGDRNTTMKPRAIETLPPDIRILQVEAGGVHSLVLSEDGVVYSCGLAEKGTVPVAEIIDDSVKVLRPVQFPPEMSEHGRIVQVTAGASFSAAVTERGSVIAWGNLRDTADSMENHAKLLHMQRNPIVLVNHAKFCIVKIAAGDNHLVMLGSRGELLTFGDASQGQLGRFSRPGLLRSQHIGDESSMHVTVQDPEHRRSHVAFVDVWAGGFISLARDRVGRVFVFGQNNYGQLGVPMDANAEDGENRILAPRIAPAFGKVGRDWTSITGWHHVLARTADGEIYGIGRNQDNALGLGTWRRVGVFPDVHEDNWKYGDLQRIVIGDPPETIAGITAGPGGSIAWNAQGQASGINTGEMGLPGSAAYAWGCDTEGQLGLGEGDSAIIPTPRLISSKHLEGYRILSVSLADQHALFLAKKMDTDKD